MPFARVGGVDDGAGPQDWFNSLPIITRYWFGAAAAMTLCGNFGVVSIYKLVFVWTPIREQFEIWRLVTPFLYAGPFKFETVIAMYMLVQFSKQYEAGGPFNTGAGGGTADYAFALLFAMASILLSYPLLRGVFQLSPVFTNTMITFVVYSWSKRNPTANANIWGIPIKAIYFPFAYLGLNVVLGNPYLDMLHGMAVAHVYYFLAHVLPLVHGKSILQTPRFLIDFFGVGEYTPAAQPPPPRNPAYQAYDNRGGIHQPQQQQQQRQPRGHNWGGGGQRLGTS